MGARLHREMDAMEISATLSSFACQLDISGKNCKKSGSSLIAQCGCSGGCCASYVAVRSCCTCAGRAQCKKLNKNLWTCKIVVCLIMGSFACQLDISGKNCKNRISSLIAQCVKHAKPSIPSFSAWILILSEC